MEEVAEMANKGIGVAILILVLVTLVLTLRIMWWIGALPTWLPFWSVG